ncbi:hypothetical protein R1sor_015538 [Riccia sorocarpa]|uniref:Uncharacterized protein n=1 Tax=Riccia sorocarpa TaxID=122646 RepID=A0ABD3HGF7_9MARC
MADQSRKKPLGLLNQVETIFGSVSFLLNYVILHPKDRHGYDGLIGRPWLYGAKVITDWARKQATFPIQVVIVGRYRKRIRFVCRPLDLMMLVPSMQHFFKPCPALFTQARIRAWNMALTCANCV